MQKRMVYYLFSEMQAYHVRSVVPNFECNSTNADRHRFDLFIVVVVGISLCVRRKGVNCEQKTKWK